MFISCVTVFQEKQFYIYTLVEENVLWFQKRSYDVVMVPRIFCFHSFSATEKTRHPPLANFIEQVGNQNRKDEIYIQQRVNSSQVGQLQSVQLRECLDVACLVKMMETTCSQ